MFTPQVESEACKTSNGVSPFKLRCGFTVFRLYIGKVLFTALLPPPLAIYNDTTYNLYVLKFFNLRE